MKDNKLTDGYIFDRIVPGPAPNLPGRRGDLPGLSGSRQPEPAPSRAACTGRRSGAGSTSTATGTATATARAWGRRSETTEHLFADFSRERQEVAARLQGLRLRLAEQARFCRAALIHRVPKAAAKILRRLEQHEPGRNLLVIGTTALYAYEFAAGVFLDSSGTPGPSG